MYSNNRKSLRQHLAVVFIGRGNDVASDLDLDWRRDLPLCGGDRWLSRGNYEAEIGQKPTAERSFCPSYGEEFEPLLANHKESQIHGEIEPTGVDALWEKEND